MWQFISYRIESQGWQDNLTVASRIVTESPRGSLTRMFPEMMASGQVEVTLTKFYVASEPMYGEQVWRWEQ